PRSAEYDPFYVFHGSNELPFSSPNLIPTALLADMWLVLPLANALVAGAVITFARFEPRRWGVIALTLLCAVVALGGVLYASLQQDLRLQQTKWAWSARSDYRIASYLDRKECIDRLVDRSD